MELYNPRASSLRADFKLIFCEKLPAQQSHAKFLS